MTIDEAIKLADSMKPNFIPYENKVMWLSQLDSKVHRETILTHENPDPETFAGYDGTTDPNTELLIASPDASEVYRFYLESCIDYANGETNKYNNSNKMYTNALITYQNWYNRTYLPITTIPYFKY